MNEALNEIKNIKNNIDIYLENVDKLRATYQHNNMLQERVFAKKSNDELKYKDLLDALRDNENNAIENYNSLVNLDFETKVHSKKENEKFNVKKVLFNEEKQKLISLQQESSGTQVLKENQYDIGIVDNMHIIYYFLSYGIIGLYVYKLLKQ